MLGLEHVSFSYGSAPVLQDVSWELPSSGVVCLWGASGCGKTTILRLLAGLEHPSAGMVHCPERVSVLFQEDRLLPWLTAVENVALPIGDDRVTAEKMLASVGLLTVADSAPAALSGGQRRRVALARALTAPGEVLLLDEPFTGVDEGSWRDLVPLIRQQAQRRPVVLVTHLMEEAVALDASVIRLPAVPLRGVLRTESE